MGVGSEAPVWRDLRAGRNELAMDHDEASAVLAHRKDASAAGLVALAEGWPAVIGLAALTDDLNLPEGSLPDSLYDYFAEELYQAASPTAQQGLCRLALAPSLSYGVVDLLLGTQGAEIIGQGARLGFFSTRSGTPELHPLLRTFLLEKARDGFDKSHSDSQRLARHFADQGLWDEAFTLLNFEFSEDLFVTLFERGIQTILDEARLATLASWLDLGHARRVDAPIMDLAEAEIAFHEGKRQMSEDLAVRATRRLQSDHSMLSRAHYIAGLSAHLAYENQRARVHCDRAFATATSLSSKRDAVSGQLIVGLDLDDPDVDELLVRLVDLDDGSATSELRLAIARFQVAVRRGDLQDCGKFFAAAEHIATRVSDPHARSSFYLMESELLALQGRYAAALESAKRCESYVKDSRLAFALPYAKRVRAIADFGLRNFSRSRSVADALERHALRDGNTFLRLEAQLIRSRLFIAQGLAVRGIEALSNPPTEFPFEAERAELLATLGLAYACAGQSDDALQAASDAEQISTPIEVRVLNSCVRAITSLIRSAPSASDEALEVFELARTIGNLDSYVTAYRGYPALLDPLVTRPKLHEPLAGVLDNARDWFLMKTAHLAPMQVPRQRPALSNRERQVLELVAQGLTNKDIAKALFISDATVKVHVRHVLEKLGVHTRTEAALIAATDDADI